jgi:hypothetical protein
VKRTAVVVAIVAAVLLLLGVGADRAVAAVAERTITQKIEESVTGASSVSTSIVGVPILTQVARGSLDHVTVRVGDLATTGGPTISSAVVELYGVSTSSPRTAERVEATADITTEELQKALGDSWKIRPDGSAFAVEWTGGLSLEARIVPRIADAKLALGLESVTILGVSVDGSVVPSAVTDRINAVAASVGRLPFDLTPTSVTVTPDGVRLVASGSHVDLEQG